MNRPSNSTTPRDITEAIAAGVVEGRRLQGAAIRSAVRSLASSLLGTGRDVPEAPNQGPCTAH